MYSIYYSILTSSTVRRGEEYTIFVSAIIHTSSRFVPPAHRDCAGRFSAFFFYTYGRVVVRGRYKRFSPVLAVTLPSHHNPWRKVFFEVLTGESSTADGTRSPAMRISRDRIILYIPLHHRL